MGGALGHPVLCVSCLLPSPHHAQLKEGGVVWMSVRRVMEEVFRNRTRVLAPLVGG